MKIQKSEQCSYFLKLLDLHENAPNFYSETLEYVVLLFKCDKADLEKELERYI